MSDLNTPLVKGAFKVTVTQVPNGRRDGYNTMLVLVASSPLSPRMGERQNSSITPAVEGYPNWGGDAATSSLLHPGNKVDS